MIAVLGGGAFGTALAIVLAKDADVRLWARDPEAAGRMAAERRNTRYLPNAPFPDRLTVHADLHDVAPTDTLLLAVPSQAFAGVLAALGPCNGKALIACCKGIDRTTLEGPTAITLRQCPDAVPAILTGPSFAAEIAAGLPTALTLATAHADGARLQQELSRPTLRLYLSDDPTGAELGGALKNVIAIAAGICIGAGYGESARAAMIARGFTEMQRVATTLGARPETLTGLSGLGDLILTAMSEHSRNMRAGLALGRGDPLPDGLTVEGAATSIALRQLCTARSLSAPILTAVADIVDGTRDVASTVDALLSRPLKDE
ncbi:MAG: NAD(P)H-dependent glycerol-3-phosphate dehydrogenase [Pseudomonadota bacterium]